jgi:hypothetical protein
MPTLEQDVEQARARFVAWLKWYMRTYPEKAPTVRAFAKELGFRGHGGLSMLLDEKRQRAPDFKTLVAARRILGFPFDVLLRSDPPQGE